MIFDETTDLVDHHQINVIISSQRPLVYVGTHFLKGNELVDNNIVARGVTLLWDTLNLPKTTMRFVLVDNAGYCKKAFADHLVVLFSNAILRTC